MSSRTNQRGSLMIAAIAILVTLGLFSAAASRLFITQTSNSTDFFLSQSTLLLAESGLEKAKYELSVNSAYTGETATAFANGTFNISVMTTDSTGTALPSDARRIRSTGNLASVSGIIITRTIETIVTLASNTSTTAFAAGKNGTILQWDGSQWNPIPTPRRLETDIKDAYCSSATNCWFVGKDGEIVHWDGTTFTTTSNSSKDLNAISCNPFNPAQCFAVGEEGTIQTWNGSSWIQSRSANRKELNGVFCLNVECYAVGKDGTILHYNGSSWIDESIGGRTDLNAIHCLTVNDCWAVGDNNNRSFTLLQRNSSGWTDRSQYDRRNNVDLNGIACLPLSSDCWAVGDNGTLMRFNGSLPWTLSSSPIGSKISDATCSSTTTECWAISSSERSGPLRWQGGGWITTPISSRNTKLSTIAIISGSGSGSGTLTVSGWEELIP